jgi:hypothetical protein
LKELWVFIDFEGFAVVRRILRRQTARAVSNGLKTQGFTKSNLYKWWTVGFKSFFPIKMMIYWWNCWEEKFLNIEGNSVNTWQNWMQKFVI